MRDKGWQKLVNEGLGELELAEIHPSESRGGALGAAVQGDSNLRHRAARSSEWTANYC